MKIKKEISCIALQVEHKTIKRISLVDILFIKLCLRNTWKISWKIRMNSKLSQFIKLFTAKAGRNKFLMNIFYISSRSDNHNMCLLCVVVYREYIIPFSMCQLDNFKAHILYNLITYISS